jgi:S-adenosylmethionine decarboxylase
MINKTKRSIQWVTEEQKDYKYAGIHLIAEFYNGKCTENKKELKKVLIETAKAGNSTVLDIIIHKFKPQGITGVVLLAESHIAIHSWPEHNYVAVDIFTCGQKAFPEKSLDYLKEKFNPKKIRVKRIKRGIV